MAENEEIAEVHHYVEEGGNKPEETKYPSSEELNLGDLGTAPSPNRQDTPPVDRGLCMERESSGVTGEGKEQEQEGDLADPENNNVFSPGKVYQNLEEVSLGQKIEDVSTEMDDVDLNVERDGSAPVNEDRDSMVLTEKKTRDAGEQRLEDRSAVVIKQPTEMAYENSEILETVEVKEEVWWFLKKVYRARTMAFSEADYTVDLPQLWINIVHFWSFLKHWNLQIC